MVLNKHFEKYTCLSEACRNLESALKTIDQYDEADIVETERRKAKNTLSERQLLKVGEQISSDWIKLATRLGIDKNLQSRLTMTASGGPAHFASTMLTRWQQLNADSSRHDIIELLCTALKEANRYDIAVQVEKEAKTEKSYDMIFEDITGSLTREWKDVAVHLGVPLSTCNEIQAPQVIEDPAKRMLEIWQQKTPVNQKQILIDALEAIKRNDIARELKTQNKQPAATMTGPQEETNVITQPTADKLDEHEDRDAKHPSGKQEMRRLDSHPSDSGNGYDTTDGSGLTLSETELFKVSEEVGNNWEMLLLRLGVPYAKIQQFSRSDPSLDAFKMLMKWVSKKRQPDFSKIKEDFINVLRTTGRADVADLVSKWPMRNLSEMEAVFSNFSPNLVAEWEKMGVKLDVQTDERKVIQASSHQMPVENPGFKLLVDWNKTTTTGIKRNMLIEALKSISYNNIANTLVVRGGQDGAENTNEDTGHCTVRDPDVEPHGPHTEVGNNVPGTLIDQENISSIQLQESISEPQVGNNTPGTVMDNGNTTSIHPHDSIAGERPVAVVSPQGRQAGLPSRAVHHPASTAVPCDRLPSTNVANAANESLNSSDSIAVGMETMALDEVRELTADDNGQGVEGVHSEATETHANKHLDYDETPEEVRVQDTVSG